MYLTLDSTHHIDQVERGKGIFLLINKIFSRPYIQIVTCPSQNEYTKMQTDIGENITLLQKNIQRCHILVLVNVLTQLLPSPLNMQNMWCYCLMIFSFISFFILDEKRGKGDIWREHPLSCAAHPHPHTQSAPAVNLADLCCATPWLCHCDTQGLLNLAFFSLLYP